MLGMILKYIYHVNGSFTMCKWYLEYLSSYSHVIHIPCDGVFPGDCFGDAEIKVRKVNYPVLDQDAPGKWENEGWNHPTPRPTHLSDPQIYIQVH